jgi:predicted membrane channel-forming protein YqfA (hemolysin III family)
VSTASITGWLAIALVALAAAVPAVHHVRVGRRAAPDSRATSLHVSIGLATAAVAFFHSLFAVLSLGSASAIGGGVLTLGAGGIAFLVLLAHTGLGLQLRDVKLRRRAEKRRAHALTASLIAIAAVVHAAALIAARD